MRVRRTISRHRRAAAAVVVATLVVAWGAVALWPPFAQNHSEQFLMLTAAAIFLALVGAIDDLRTLPAALRLALQFIAVGRLRHCLRRMRSASSSQRRS
jgi:UDP-N-acetylmuramyl pentapeptide phosphotransferase/UDP-N-acetylglucosamine-1-phosphate transferase